MKLEWVEYQGTEDQINLLLSTKNKFIVDSKWSVFKEPTSLALPNTSENINWLSAMLKNSKVKKYLICQSHPYADMICQQAQTGQPVWFKHKHDPATGECNSFHLPFAYPETYEYRLSPFEEEV